ncbi:MAG: hypothetical protein KGZ58_13455 [Ignavibacteriales bacterium]|nr:hypothetical protein [Ignavibacteriales bacterium]
MKHHKLNLAIFTFVFFLFTLSVVAGEKTSIANISLGGTGVANSGGINAIGTNPARLLGFDRPRILEEIEYSVSHDSLVQVRELAETTRVYTQTVMKETTYSVIEPIQVTHDTLIITENDTISSQTTHDSIKITIRTEQVPRDSTYFVKETMEISNKKIITATHDTVIYLPEELPNFTLTLLPPFSFNVRTDFINYDIYSTYFTGTIVNGKKIGKHLTDNDKKEILELFPEGLAETHFDFETRLVGLTIHNNTVGSLGFSVTEKFYATFDLPKDYLRFPLYLLDTAGTVYDFSGTTIKAQEIREYAFSYARSIDVSFVDNLVAGISVKIVQGLFRFDLDKYDVRVGTERYTDSLGQAYRILGDANIHYYSSMASVFDSNGTASPFPHDAGKGTAFDFGVSFTMYENIHFGLSIIDIGSMEWTRNVVEGKISSRLRVASFNTQADQESIDAFIEDIEKNISDLKGDTISTINSDLPTALLLGSAWRGDISFLGNVLLAFQYKQGFNNALGNSKRSRFSVGGEYRPWNWFPLRMGMAVGGKDRFSISGGMGLDFYYFNWDIGSENIGFLFTPKGFNQFSFGTGIRLRF